MSGFCELSTEFQDGQWMWFGILIAPCFIVFAGIYRLFRLPLKKFGVMFSVVSSTLTWAGLGAILIYSFDITSRYPACGVILSATPDFGDNETEDSALTWYLVGICVSVFLYIIFFIFSLKADVVKHVFGGVNKIRALKGKPPPKCNKIQEYFLKLLVIIVKFGLGAIFQPFYSVGYYGDSGEKCYCVDDYIWSIAILFSIMLFTPITTKTTDSASKIDQWLEVRPKKWPKPFEFIKKWGKIALIFIKWSGLVTMFIAAITIIVIRFQVIINDIIDLANSVSVSKDGKASGNWSLLKVEYLVVFLLAVHVIIGLFFRKYLNGDVESTLGKRFGNCLFKCLGCILCNWCEKCHKRAAFIRERADTIKALEMGAAMDINVLTMDRARSNSAPTSRRSSVASVHVASLAGGVGVASASISKHSQTVRRGASGAAAGGAVSTASNTISAQVNLEDLIKSHKELNDRMNKKKGGKSKTNADGGDDTKDDDKKGDDDVEIKTGTDNENGNNNDDDNGIIDVIDQNALADVLSSSDDDDRQDDVGNIDSEREP